MASYEAPGVRAAYSTPDTAPVGIADEFTSNGVYIVTDQVTGSVTAFEWPRVADR